MKSSDLKVVAIILSIALFFTIITSNAVSIASVVILAKGGSGATVQTGGTAQGGTVQQGTVTTPGGTTSTTPDAGTTTPDTGTTTPEQPSNPEEGNGDAGSEVPEPGESEESESDSNE